MLLLFFASVSSCLKKDSFFENVSNLFLMVTLWKSCTFRRNLNFSQKVPDRFSKKKWYQWKIDDTKDTEKKPMEKFMKMFALVCACIFRSFLFFLPHVQRPSKVSVASFDLIAFNFFIFTNLKAQSWYEGFKQKNKFSGSPLLERFSSNFGRKKIMASNKPIFWHFVSF